MARRRDAKQPKVRREAGGVRHRLGPNAAMIRGEFYRLRGVLAQAARAFQSQQVGGIRYDFGAANRRYDFILARERDDRTGAERCQRRELQGFKRRCGRQQMAV